MMGNLFSRRVSTVEIKKMSYREMKYWNGWHELMSKQEEKIANDITRVKGKK